MSFRATWSPSSVSRRPTASSRPSTRLTAENGRTGRVLNSLFLVKQPQCRIGNVVEAGIVERHAASRYPKGLSSIGVLEEKAEGRKKTFTHPGPIAILTSDSHEFDLYGLVNPGLPRPSPPPSHLAPLLALDPGGGSRDPALAPPKTGTGGLPHRHRDRRSSRRVGYGADTILRSCRQPGSP